jgi:hypothetical protein
LHILLQLLSLCRLRTQINNARESHCVSDWGCHICSHNWLSLLLQSIVAQDGVSGLFTRGLATRIAANGLQNICFTVLWQLGQDKWKQAAVNK